jgi:hypothetical protein
LVSSFLLGQCDSDEYVFILDTKRLVDVVAPHTFSMGRLDAAGNFSPLPELTNLSRHEALSGIPPSEPLNGRAEKNVYEFRSGRLIKGEVDNKGNFVPEIGAKVIDFKDYHYRPGGPRIWNLPGRFEKKTKTS